MLNYRHNQSLISYDNITEISHTNSNIDYIFLTIVISVLSFIGILGNVPVLLVYFRRKDRKASNTFIKCLAVQDLMVCILVMPYTIVYEYHIVTSDVTCRFFELFRHFAIFASNATLLAIAVERYVAVCHIGTKIRVRTINHCVYVIFVLALIVAAPSVGIFAVVKAEEVDHIPCSYPHEKTVGYFCHFTYTIMGKTLVTTYQIVQMVLFFIELIAIIVLYTAIYAVLWKKAQIRKQLTKGRDSNIMSEILDFNKKREGSVPLESSGTDNPSKNKLPPSPKAEPVHDYKKNGIEKEIYPLNTISDSNIQQATPMCNILEKDNQIQNDVREYLKNEKEFIEKDVLITQSFDSKVTFENKPKNEIQVKESENGVVKMAQTEERGSRKSEKTRNKRSYHRRTAKMLFLCTVVYFVTWVPFWLDVFGLTNSLILRYLIFIAHATNPIIYGIVNKQVRRSFKHLFENCLKTICYVKTTYKENNISNVPTSFSETSL